MVMVSEVKSDLFPRNGDVRAPEFATTNLLDDVRDVFLGRTIGERVVRHNAQKVIGTLMDHRRDGMPDRMPNENESVAQGTLSSAAPAVEDSWSNPTWFSTVESTFPTVAEKLPRRTRIVSSWPACTSATSRMARP